MKNYNKIKSKIFSDVEQKCVFESMESAKKDGILGNNASVKIFEDEILVEGSQRSLRYGPNSEVDEKISIQQGGLGAHAFINKDESNSPSLWNQSSALRDKFKSCLKPKIF